MNKAARNILILAVVILAVLSTVVIRTGRSVFIAIENGTEDVLYSALVQYGYDPKSPPMTYRSSVAGDEEIEPGKRWQVGLAPSSVKRLTIEENAFPIRIEVGMEKPDTVSHVSRLVSAGEVLVPVQRGKCCVIVVTGSKEEGYKASYSHVERAAVWMLIFTH